MSTSKSAPDRVVSVKPRDHLLGTRDGAPVAHEVADDGEQADNLDTSAGHAVVGDVTDKSRVGTRGLGVGPDGVALSAKRESEEGGADVGGDTSEDDLGLAVAADNVSELLVVPGIDLALALDKGGVGVHVDHFLHERTVGACEAEMLEINYQLQLRCQLTGIGRGGHDNRQVKGLAQGGVGKSLLLVESGIKVAGELVETLLDIDNEQESVILHKSLIVELCVNTTMSAFERRLGLGLG